MVALETLTTSPKAPKAKLSEQDPQENTTLSFGTLLKELTKKSIALADKGMIILPEEQNKSKTTDTDDTAKVLLNLLHPQEEKGSKESETLPQLLKTDAKSTPKQKDNTQTPITLNLEISNKLSPQEMKYLVYKAKKYLKEKITTHPEFNEQQNQEVPKTLKGLLVLAKELKIDLSKITFETIAHDEIEQNNNDEFLDELITEPKKTKVPKTTRQDVEQTIHTNKAKTYSQEIKTIETKLQNNTLFQERPLKTEASITTKELINTKNDLKTDKKSKKSTQDNPLRILLSGKESSATQLSKELVAPLFAPQQTKEQPDISKHEKSQEIQSSILQSSLEELLHPKTNGDEHPLQVNKSDSLEVKMQEAKQMMRYLSQDIKKAIDDYKPPFSRVKVSLNPQKLGEIDLTVVQRGKNVHINLSSNNAALNILTNNLNELKTQLNQNGINNASFSFNSQGQNEQQQQQHKQKHQYEFIYNDTDEEYNEMINSLEIIVPRYI